MLRPSAAGGRRAHREPAPGKSSTEIQTLLELGQGGMATAYLARALGTGGFERFVVLKRLNAQLAGIHDAVERFNAEARVAARLHHANVVGTQQIGWDEDGPFIVLDYVEGGSLSDLLEAADRLDERLPSGVVLRVALDVLAGLRAVHEATDSDGRSLDILHRDISLENVLVGVTDGVARLSDFGVAKSALGPSITEPGCFVGKVLYFAPEYLLREPIGATLDLYALGVTLWLALSGDDLWPGKTDGRLARAIVEEGVPSLDGRRGIPAEVSDFIARACAREAKLRFQSAREMRAILEGFERRGGFIASHAEVAQCVERLLGRRLRERRETVAKLLAELAAPRSGERLELGETVSDPRAARGRDARPRRAEPIPTLRSTPHDPRPQTHALRPEREAPRRSLRAPFVVAPLLLLVAGAAASLWWRAPERPLGAPHVVASELTVTAAPSEADAAPRLASPPRVLPTESSTAEPAESPLQAVRRPVVLPRHPPLETKRAAPAPPSASSSPPTQGEIARKNPYR
jgi:serine/threonine-protein kinase